LDAGVCMPHTTQHNATQHITAQVSDYCLKVAKLALDQPQTHAVGAVSPSRMLPSNGMCPVDAALTHMAVQHHTGSLPLYPH